MENSSKKITIDKIILFILMIMCSFGYMITNMNYILIVSLFFAFVTILYRINKIKFLTQDLLWILFLLWCIISVFNSSSVYSSLKFIFMIASLLIVKISVNNYIVNCNYIINVLWLFTSIHVICTLMFLIIPNQMLNLIELLYYGKDLNEYINLYNAGSFPGITMQTGVNGFLILIFNIITFMKLFNNKNKTILYMCCSALGMLALLLTAKRIFILSAFLVLIFVAFLSNRNCNTHNYQFFILVIVLALAFLILYLIPQSRKVIEKMLILEEVGDISNGRNDIWKETWYIFLENPFVGVGINTLVATENISSHNVYLQLLAETGWIGAIIFIFLMIYNFLFTLKKSFEYGKNKMVYAEDLQIYIIALMLQLVFIIYCFTGNPLYGHIFITPYFIAMIICNNIEYKYKTNDEGKLIYA